MNFPASALVLTPYARALQSGSFFVHGGVWSCVGKKNVVRLTGDQRGKLSLAPASAVLSLADGWKLEPVVGGGAAFSRGVPVMGSLGITLRGPAIFGQLLGAGEEIILLPSGDLHPPEDGCHWQDCDHTNEWGLELVSPSGERYKL